MIVDLMRQGGPVLWIIVAIGFVAFCVFIERGLHLHRADINTTLTGIKAGGAIPLNRDWGLSPDESQ